MARCQRCLYPDTKPDLFFNDQGVCSACTAHDKRKEIDWTAREGELLRLLEMSRRKGADYDCIVPSSGGKDSHYQVLKLIELGVRPLVVTAMTCHLTDIGRANIDNLKRYATTLEIQPVRPLREKLNRAGLELVGDISWPEHVSILTAPFKAANDLDIPLIFYGESPQNQYGGPPGTEDAREMTLRWVQEFGGFLGLRPGDLIGRDGITEIGMAEYMPIPVEHVKQGGITAYFLGQFYEWDSRRNARVAVEAGMKTQLPCSANIWEFENLDNAQTGIHDYFCWLKHGFGRATAQLSVDIRNGMIDRDDAEALAARSDGRYPDEYMGVSLAEILDRIGMTVAEFDAIAARFAKAA